MAEKYVITIARQHGSGGLKIGKRLAEALGIACYDSEMLKLVSDSSNMRDKHVAHDDRIKDTSLFEIASQRYDGSELPKESDDFISMRNLFEYQSDIIRELADRESCVIVGRCANYILQDRNDVVSIFIHAPMEYRVRRSSSVHSMTEKELERYISSIDRHRASYYKYYTKSEWTDLRNYDLSLNSEVLGIQRCVDEIVSYIKIRFGEI